MKPNSTLIITVCLFLISARTAAPNYGIGDTVSDFKLKNVDGRMISLSDYKTAKGVILIFDCNTCPYSKAYNDRIIALHKKYSGEGYPVITINSNDSEQSPGDSFEQMVSRARTRNYDFPYLLDERQQVARAFGATNTPHVFIVQRKGTDFVVAYIGAIDNNARNGSLADRKYVEDAVNALLSGGRVPVEETKAVGCGIRWKDA
ncbi:MAG: thioredoxin family protein [Chryseosolibacter sp.]